MSLSLFLVWKAELAARAKAAFLALLTVAGFIILTAVLRVVIATNDFQRKTAYVGFYSCSVIETSTAVILANAIVFGFLVHGNYDEDIEDQRFVQADAGIGDLIAQDQKPTITTIENLSSTKRSRKKRRRQGIETEVTAIPLTERTPDMDKSSLGEILVTQEIDQRTLDSLSIFSTETDLQRTPTTHTGAFTPKSAKSSNYRPEWAINESTEEMIPRRKFSR